MFRKFSFVLIAMFLIVSVALAEVFDSPKRLEVIKKDLPELSSITCNFRQEKSFSNTAVKIKSGGKFKYIQGKGVVFHTLYPNEVVTTYNSSEYRQINDVINTISSNRYEKIEKIFNFYFVKNGVCWQLGLKPKQTHNSAKYLNYIEIQGRDFITKIVISTKSSGCTTIWFEK